MVGTSWGMHLGMTGTGMLLTGSDGADGRCIFEHLNSFLFFLAGVHSGAGEQKGSKGNSNKGESVKMTFSRVADTVLFSVMLTLIPHLF